MLDSQYLDAHLLAMLLVEQVDWAVFGVLVLRHIERLSKQSYQLQHIRPDTFDCSKQRIALVLERY